MVRLVVVLSCHLILEWPSQKFTSVIALFLKRIGGFILEWHYKSGNGLLLEWFAGRRLSQLGMEKHKI